MGDQGLLDGQLQPEFLTQERRKLALDLLGFSLRSDETQEMVVGIAGIPQPPVAGIVRITLWDATKVPTKCPSLIPVPASARIR